MPVFTKLVDLKLFLGVKIQFEDIPKTFETEQINQNCDWDREWKYDDQDDFLKHQRPKAIRNCKHKYTQKQFEDLPFSVWKTNHDDFLVIGRKFEQHANGTGNVTFDATKEEKNELINATTNRLQVKSTKLNAEIFAFERAQFDVPHVYERYEDPNHICCTCKYNR